MLIQSRLILAPELARAKDEMRRNARSNFRSRPARSSVMSRLTKTRGGF